jgi:SAM-dependent methyltransferase
MLYEENSNTFTTQNYWIPLFQKLWSDRVRPSRLLSVGCGIGIDVDLLAANRFECVGIDCGNRTDFWRRREHPERLLLANGMHLPFEDASFDGVFCGCVFPHVGVGDDTYEVTPEYQEDRQRLAREMTRVLRPGGKILVSSPNRRCPFDLFHDRAEGSYRPRVNSPSSPFLLSHADHRSLFQAAGCTTTRLQPVHQYWGFLRSQHSLKGRMAGALPQFVFWLVSQPGARWLLNSPLNPWLVVLAEKPIAS